MAYLNVVNQGRIQISSTLVFVHQRVRRLVSFLIETTHRGCRVQSDQELKFDRGKINVRYLHYRESVI